jgi:ubiquitin thioesterase protein OTUB1
MLQEPLSSLAAEFQSGSPILQEKIKVSVCLAILIRSYWILCQYDVLVCCSLVCSYGFLLVLQLLGEQYNALRRTRGDGNCFYRSFMFSYLVVSAALFIKCNSSYCYVLTLSFAARNTS